MTTDGEVYTWGACQIGLLGLHLLLPSAGSLVVVIWKAFAYFRPYFSLLFRFLQTPGRGDDGRLGHGDNGWKYVPRIIQSLTGQVVAHVTCGSYHTAAVTTDGALYTWGGGMYGKLGHGNEAGCSTPKRVDGLAGLIVAQIACGSRHTVALVSTGAAYSWGDMENGVAGHGLTEGHQYTPRLLDRLAGRNVVQVSVRMLRSLFHMGSLTDLRRTGAEF